MPLEHTIRPVRRKIRIDDLYRVSTKKEKLMIPNQPQLAQPSASALNVARCRAIAAHDTRPAIQGQDYLAEVFLDEAGRQSLTNPVVFPLILKKLDAFSPGAYEYFIARTAYLDQIVKQAFADHRAQIVFLGAGYDTRAYRFADLIGAARVFELDEAVTQAHKRAVLQAANIASPAQLTFVALDFTVDDLAEKLRQAGYDPTAQTLFIWEGVTYYLPPATVNATLDFIRSNSARGSRVAFDYMLPEAQCEGRFGAQQARAGMRSLYTSEPLHFDLDEAQISTFLAQRGFELVEHLSADEMQTRYLMLPDGTPAGHMLDLFRLVQAQTV